VAPSISRVGADTFPWDIWGATDLLERLRRVENRDYHPVTSIDVIMAAADGETASPADMDRALKLFTTLAADGLHARRIAQRLPWIELYQPPSPNKLVVISSVPDVTPEHASRLFGGRRAVIAEAETSTATAIPCRFVTAHTGTAISLRDAMDFRVAAHKFGREMPALLAEYGVRSLDAEAELESRLEGR